MLAIVWNPRGFHWINILENGGKFNVMHYVIETVSPLSDWYVSDVTESDLKLTVYEDNARPDTARLLVAFFEANRIKTAPHPPYSPDIAPSDFYLFGHLKGCLADRSLVDAGEFF
jgi:hypothetical protein